MTLNEAIMSTSDEQAITLWGKIRHTTVALEMFRHYLYETPTIVELAIAPHTTITNAMRLAVIIRHRHPHLLKQKLRTRAELAHALRMSEHNLSSAPQSHYIPLAIQALDQDIKPLSCTDYLLLPDALTGSQLAERLGISSYTLNNWLANGTPRAAALAIGALHAGS